MRALQLFLSDGLWNRLCLSESLFPDMISDKYRWLLASSHELIVLQISMICGLRTWLMEGLETLTMLVVILEQK